MHSGLKLVRCVVLNQKKVSWRGLPDEVVGVLTSPTQGESKKGWPATASERGGKGGHFKWGLLTFAC